MAVVAVIVIGGASPPRAVVDVLPTGRFVIAADSGYDHARALGMTVDLLVGDLDSITAAGLAHARSTGVEIEAHPADKDATDTELAIDAAEARGCTEIVGVFGGGDRIDHTLAALFAFTAPQRTAATTLWWGDTRIVVIHGGEQRSVPTAAGAAFSVLPLHGAADGVGISGARYALDGATLAAGSSLGVSNVARSEPTVVRLGSGTLVHVTPRALSGDRR